MDMAWFSKRNRERCQAKNGFNHKLQDWTASEWMVATLGELGEAANIIKKLNRVRDGITGNKGKTKDELLVDLEDELADAFIYLDLMAQALDISLEEAVIDKFNQKSAEIGYDKTI